MKALNRNKKGISKDISNEVSFLYIFFVFYEKIGDKNIKIRK